MAHTINTRGFTLVETLIALLIVSIFGLITAHFIRQQQKINNRLHPSVVQLKHLALAHLQLSNDFNQPLKQGLQCSQRIKERIAHQKLNLQSLRFYIKGRWQTQHVHCKKSSASAIKIELKQSSRGKIDWLFIPNPTNTQKGRSNTSPA